MSTVPIAWILSTIQNPCNFRALSEIDVQKRYYCCHYPKYARFLQVYGIIVKSKDLNSVNFSLLLWATVIERICAQMYYSPVSQFLANLLLVLHWTRYCGMDSGILPRHEFAIDSGGRHLLLTSKLNTAPLYQVSMPFSSHIFCPLYVDRLCWN